MKPGIIDGVDVLPILEKSSDVVDGSLECGVVQWDTPSAINFWHA